MKILFVLFILVAAIDVSSQKPQTGGFLEINPYLRYDKYPPFNNSINSVSRNDLKISGSGWGTNLLYHFKSNQNFHFRVGMGYYRYSFNNIISESPSFGIGHQRIIKYTGMGDLNYTTNKYWYNTLTLSVGAQKKLVNHNNFEVNAGVLGQYYFSFSQYYRIVEDAPAGPPDHRFTRQHRRGFAFSGNIDLNFLFHISQFSIGPTVQIPIYDRWQQDQIFPGEEDSRSRSKWLNGIAPGLSTQFHF